MIYKQLWGNLARPGWLGGRVPRVPGPTFLHVNRALDNLFWSICFSLQVIFALNQTLNFQEKMRYGEAQLTYTTDDLIDHYNCGDLTTVLFSAQATQLATLNSNSSQHNEEFQKAQEIDRYFRKALIFERNKRMAKRVMDLLKSYPERDFFFAFGAGWFL